MNQPAPNIVFVDNNISHLFKTLEALKGIYENIHLFTNESEALEFISTHNTDIVFLNLDLHPNDAVTLANEIIQRKQLQQPFIVIYSEKQDDFIFELAFNSGVDSFINFHTKPAVMKLFIRNLLSRRKKPEDKTVKNMVVDPERFLIFKKGQAMQLPKKEFRVFELLFNNPNKFFSKLEIATLIWNDAQVASKRIIDVHIYNIRKSFGRRIIQSQKGKGYRFNAKLI